LLVSDSDKRSREEREFSRELFHLKEDAGAGVNAAILQDWNALKASLMKNHETRSVNIAFSK